MAPSQTKMPVWSFLDATDPAVVWCATHDGHHWVELRVGDAVYHCDDPEERMVICARCYVPRCGHTTDLDPCLMPRHHATDHVTRSGARQRVGA